MLHCKRTVYEKYGSRPAGGEPSTAGLPSVENGWCLLLEQTRVQRHAVLQIDGIREVQYCAHTPWMPSTGRIIPSGGAAFDA